MHDDRWEGQRWQTSPGNLYSAPGRMRLDASSGYFHEIAADQVIPPIDFPPDTAWVKRFRFESKLLSEFWGRPIHLGATILLPRDYERETIPYPVVYVQGHFSLADPMNWKEGEDFYRAWTSDHFPRMIVVTLQDPNPYFDTSYSVNSANVGPYGDALHEELIPEIERRFRILRKPYARVLTGGSTGGWEALAMQIFNPDFYGGAFAYAPDPVSFVNVEGIDIYKDGNAFYKQHEWRRVPIANTRSQTGEVRLTSEQRNRFELVAGTRGRSGEQFDIWSAVFGPLGPDGYFQPLFDKDTGRIDRAVAEHWRENFDLVHILKRDWESKGLGKKLEGKLHIYVGDMDNYYLNNAVYLAEEFLESTRNPYYNGEVDYGDRAEHCWNGDQTRANAYSRLRYHQMFIPKIVERIQKSAPAGADVTSWKC